MERILKLVIVVAVALSVPLQGAAAVSAAQCMALGHHDAAASQGHDHEQDHHQDHHQDGAGHHAHEAPGVEDKSAHCGPCAACCASASIAAPLPLFSPPAPGGAAQALPAPFHPGFQPEELDRPPLVL
jgi:hypothetical protein